MKKTLIAAALVGAAFGGVANAAAIEFFAFDEPNAIFLRNVAAPGNTRSTPVVINYDPLLWSTVTTASLWVQLADNADRQSDRAILSSFSPDRVIDLPDGAPSAWYDVGDVTSFLKLPGVDTFMTMLSAAPGKSFFYNNAKLVVSTFSPVPEAGEALLLGAGLLAVCGMSYRRRRATDRLA